MSSAHLCSPETSRLVIVDLQIRLSAAMPEIDRAAMVQNTDILLQAATALEVPVVCTEQYPRGLGSTVPTIVNRLPKTALRLEKTSFSCGDADGFLNALNFPRRAQVILVGQEAHVCVLQTAFDLTARGYRVFVVEDAVCSRSAAHRRNALSRLRDGGIVITNVESVLFEWLRDAAHPQFKTLSALIR
jgi:nicotinamidase-related amidase